MQLDDFHYELPEALIAQHPLEDRGASRLLHLAGGCGIRDRRFRELPDLLRPGDLVVLNDTKVLPARLFGRKATGGEIEVLVERVIADDVAMAQVRASKSPKPGSRLEIGGVGLVMEGREQDLFRLRVERGTFAGLMEAHGHMPLPPYIRRPDNATDQARYQTVFGATPGAVAAPTAGLHFDQGVLDRLEANQIRSASITLHVGAGTFQPVREQDLDRHRMHSEWLDVNREAVDAVLAARADGGRVVAVGTTAVRSLETAAATGVLQPHKGETRLFIRPGYRFRVVDVLLTNFHLPRSTLLMLVCAFAGYQRTMAAYRHAVDAGYRFFSYGDAMLIEPRA